MDYKAEVLDCPNCGAPLNVVPGNEFTFCDYCQSTIRINRHGETGSETASHMDVPPEVISDVKNLILNGSKAEAIALYMKSAGIDKETAEKLVGAMVDSLMTRTILSRPLNAKGVSVSALFIAVAASMAYLLISGKADETLWTVVCWVLLLFSLLNVLSLTRSIITTIKFMNVKWTKATVLKYVLVSSKKNLNMYKILVEVQGYGGIPFRAETNVMMKAENSSKLQEGKIIHVKYFEDDKKNIIASLENLLK